MLREYKTVAFKATVTPTEGDDAGLQPNQFEGYAATWDLDDVGDIIEKGAFANALEYFLSDGAVCWQHDWTEPVGKPLEAREDDEGLYLKGNISLTTRGKDALILLRDGVVTKLSIGYETLGYRVLSDDEGRELLGDAGYEAAMRNVPWYRDGLRVLTDIKLYEVSLVTIPANPMAAITGVKEGSLAGLTLDDHFRAVLATEREYIGRVKGVLDLRRKDGRVLSASNREKISTMRSSLAEHLNTLDELLAESLPKTDDDDPSADSDDGKAAEAEIEHKAALAALARQEYLRFQRLEAHFNGAL
jgi:HK97 family phage prohead protease